MLNRTDRFGLAVDLIDRVPGLPVRGAHAGQRFRDGQSDRAAHARAEGVDRADVERRTSSARWGQHTRGASR